MSGTCLIKKGRSYSCSECGRKGLLPTFDQCPFCGEQIVMRWDGDNDCQLATTQPEDTPDGQ